MEGGDRDTVQDEGNASSELLGRNYCRQRRKKTSRRRSRSWWNISEVYSLCAPSFRGTHKLLLQQMFMICWMTVAAIRQLSRHGGSTYNIERSQKYSGSGNLDLGFGNCSWDVRANSRNKLPSLTEQLGAKCLHCWYDDGKAGWHTSSSSSWWRRKRVAPEESRVELNFTNMHSLDKSSASSCACSVFVG